MSSRVQLLSITVVALTLVLLALRCGPDSSGGLSEDQFVEVYVQLSMAKQMFGPDSLRLGQERERVLKETGVSQKEIDRFTGRLSEEPHRWAEVWKKIVERLEERRQDLSQP
jgi:hypothetical protein